jgi:hypothetical protein
MLILLIALVWLGSLALFVALRAKATKSRLDRGFTEARPPHADASRSAYGRDAGSARLLVPSRSYRSP